MKKIAIGACLFLSLTLAGCSENNETRNENKTNEDSSTETKSSKEASVNSTAETKSNKKKEEKQFGEYFEEEQIEINNEKYTPPENISEYTGEYSGSVTEDTGFNQKTELHVDLKVNDDGTFTLLKYEMLSGRDEKIFYVDEKDKVQSKDFEIQNEDLISGVVEEEYGELSLKSVENVDENVLGLDQEGNVQVLTKNLKIDEHPSTSSDAIAFDGDMLKDVYIGDEVEPSDLELKKEVDNPSFIANSANQLTKEIKTEKENLDFDNLTQVSHIKK
ncbi:hypothetical protein [Tetragenococcus halophilus]|uniref:hypothetical protein n=1 Tax=Tetragenococcus halophilus TaxID=51669 RepID=UPI0030EB1096